MPRLVVPMSGHRVTSAEIAKITPADLARIEKAGIEMIEKCSAVRQQTIELEGQTRQQPFGALSVPLIRLAMSDASIGISVGQSLVWLANIEKRLLSLGDP